MKKLSVLLLVVVLGLVCLTACGSEEVTLETKTVNGISVDVPSDLDEFTEKAGQQTASGPNCSVVISTPQAADTKREQWTEELYNTVMSQSYTNIKITEFDNKATINGLDVVKASCTADNADGENLMFTSVFVYIDDQFQMVQLTAKTGADSSVEKNAKAIVASVKQESK